MNGIETMLTNHDWFDTNLRQRFIDKSVDLSYIINPYRFKSTTFDKATDLTCEQLLDMNKQIFVSFSGGYDSEYVLRSLHKNSTNIIPIIVKCGDTDELKYANETCRQLKLEPIILEISEDDFLNYGAGACIYRLGGESFLKTWFEAKKILNQNGFFDPITNRRKINEKSN